MGLYQAFTRQAHFSHGQIESAQESTHATNKKTGEALEIQKKWCIEHTYILETPDKHTLISQSRATAQ